MAIASRWLAQQFNRPDFTMFDIDVYTICSDGDMMEGVASEAASLAGHLMLANLCWIYDSNPITIEGHTDLAFSEDVAARFKAYGWNVQQVSDANDARRFARRSKHSVAPTIAPTLIIVDSIIGYGAPHKQDTARPTASRSAPRRSGSPSATMAGRKTRKFLVPDGVSSISTMASAGAGEALHDDWREALRRLRKKYPDLARRARSHAKRELPDGWDADIAGVPRRREGSRHPRRLGQGAQRDRDHYPWLIGGAADLAPSTKTDLIFESAGDLEADSARRPQHAFRRARTRHGRDRQWHGAVQAAALRRDVPHLFATT